ncbi:thymidylate kinase [Thermovirga lienii DSM 17291]|jgi:dTMP kinase|uniref:Thymidylate kinase n=2 Tax=Thermovirga TaxID=336260 RepID=G7VAB6_THELD|nr:thymidylate kinase [Thermovirga lienii DSM 17291]KUK43056.1 MAG: Thymidylate kinase [Thermovirga lienii]MDN5318165.1 dTMP kinase [Thermovirga sp.]MDN5367376.1 dTMP kinase [Thermovirga sp.]HCD71889.1 dTMP kinase [Thermovirga lienii]
MQLAMFITLEGIDGSGKSSQAERVAEIIKGIWKDKNVVLTHEPGGWPGGIYLRNTIIETHFSNPWAELFLFISDRCEHVERVIAPALNEGNIVVSERYNDSTLAYQVWGRCLPEKDVRTIINIAKLPEPDLTFWFDVSVDVAVKRLSKRGNLDRIEKDLHLLERIAEGYKTLWRENPNRIKRIDANKDEKLVCMQLTEELRKYAEEKSGC